MEQDASDKFTNKIFAEERVSLSHINHPNVASVLDSGELHEGNAFIITEYVEGASVKDAINRKGEFNASRTARIIRQVSYALSEVHQNGILHRNLKPENIILTLNEEGAEQVKLINFGVPNAKITKENLAYKSPEQLEGNIATFASDLYSLAVITFQMLTNRLPFNDLSSSVLLKSQREGIALRPTNLRLDLPPAIDTIFEKALAFNPSGRYPKTRDFGDAFYNALNAAASFPKEERLLETDEIDLLPNEKIEENVRKAFTQNEENPLFVSPVGLSDNAGEDFELEIPPLETEPEMRPVVSAMPFVAPILAEDSDDRAQEIPKDLAWEKRSPEPQIVASSSKTLLSLLGVTILLAAMFAVWYFAGNRTNQNPTAPATTENINAPIQNTQNEAVQNTESAPLENLNAVVKSSPALEDIEVPPPARSISPPPDTVFFETSKQNLKGDLLRNFVGFSLYYPKDWVKNESGNNFIDIAKKSADGKPIEQLLVGYYDGKGTFNADKENFPKLAEKSDKDLAKIIPNYQTMSAGETEINGGWRAYEVKFQGGGKVTNGEKRLIVWGRRIWIPAARPGTKNGFVVTMVATSLSPEIGSVDDVGVKGDLGTVFETFEPNQNF